MQAANLGHDAAGEAFWRFSLTLYARPGVADALIAMQDRAGRDVNLILFGLWLGAVRGARLDEAALSAAVAAAAPVNAVVAPLRALRRQFRDAPDPEVRALRARIAALEIAAERRAQQRLATSLRQPSQHEADRFAAAAANLALCVGSEEGSAEAGVLRDALAALMRIDRRP